MTLTFQKLLNGEKVINCELQLKVKPESIFPEHKTNITLDWWLPNSQRSLWSKLVFAFSSEWRWRSSTTSMVCIWRDLYRYKQIKSCWEKVTLSCQISKVFKISRSPQPWINKYLIQKGWTRLFSQFARYQLTSSFSSQYPFLCFSCF